MNITYLKNLLKVTTKNPNALIPVYDPTTGQELNSILVADLVGGEAIRFPWLISTTYMIDDLAEWGNKIWKSKVDNNTANQPSENAFWTEVSASTNNGTALQPWAAGVFSIVNSSVTVANAGYLLSDTVTLPFNSTDFNAELIAGKWLPLGGSGGGGGHTIKDSTTTLTQRAGLKFIGNVAVADDSIGDNTVVEILGQNITVDSVPTDGSNNPVASNGVFDALALKVNTSDQTASNTSVAPPTGYTSIDMQGLSNEFALRNWREDLTAWVGNETTLTLTSNVFRDFGTVGVSTAVTVTLTAVTFPQLAHYAFKFKFSTGGSFSYTGVHLANGNPTLINGKYYEASIIRGEVIYREVA